MKVDRSLICLRFQQLFVAFCTYFLLKDVILSIVVFSSGLVKEFDAPSRLMEQPSLFGAMVQEYGNRSSDL
jgi:hypothetical protein